MPSESDNHSSSSEGKRKNREERSRSRSRDRDRRSDNRDKDRDRRVKIKVPEITAPFFSFKHFCNLQIDKISNEMLQKGYEKYKREWEHRQNEQFLKEYKKDAWFSEKYDPEVLDLLERDRKENNKRLHLEFIQNLEAGHFDNVNLRIKQPSQLGVVEKVDEDEEINSNLSYIINQTFDIHMNPLIDISKEPYFGFDQDFCTLFIKAVPRPISRYDIRSVVEKLDGYKYLTMSDPVKKMNLTRFCWIEFTSQEACNRAALTLSGIMIKNETLTVSKSSTKVKRVKVLKNYPSTRLETDIDTLSRLIAKLDEEVGILANPINDRDYGSLSTKFDIFLIYLRRVHAYDYFTSTMYENERILALKVGSSFLRIESDYEEIDNTQTVFKKIQEKSEQRILKGNEIPDYMNILREEIEVHIRESEKLSKDDVKEIWKCSFCDKKFKTCEFLSKHMIARHEEIKFKKIQVIMEQLYLKDPFKITFNSLGDRSQGRRGGYQGNFRRENRRREYKDFDEPEADKPAKGNNGVKALVNFLDI